VTFSTEDETPRNTGIKVLDESMRSPAWLTVAVLLGAVALLAPVLTINEITIGRAAAFTASVFFLLTGFIAFNFESGRARIVVLATWLLLGLGLRLGGHDGFFVSWLIFGIAALAGCEILSRSVMSIRSVAVTDSLTGLLNRTGLIAESGRAIALCRRLDQPVSMVHIDLDGFKAINDREGHAQGDRILRLCAENWAGAIRESDVLARIGGDEFLLVLPGSDSNDARQLVGDLRKSSPIEWSFGVAELAPGEELQACVDRADAELYAHKRTHDK
jgi:diguanylate cyclase (GGDEF)-like protein